jgi:general secretion pathway protein J
MPTLPNPNRGFTLIEILIALAIFAIITGVAYNGVIQFSTSAQRLEHSTDTLGTLQYATALLEYDVIQLAPRAYRDSSGSFRTALMSDGSSLEFTRTGYPDLGDNSSALIRVRYLLEDETLVRQVWRHVDNVSNEPDAVTEVLTDVREIQFVTFNGAKWDSTWPANTNQVNLDDTSLPAAIQVEIVHKDWGQITRLLPGNIE